MKVHIPTTDAFMCGTQSTIAEVNLEMLCRRCQDVLKRKIHAAIIDRFHDKMRADMVLIDVFGGEKTD